MLVTRKRQKNPSNAQAPPAATLAAAAPSHRSPQCASDRTTYASHHNCAPDQTTGVASHANGPFARRRSSSGPRRCCCHRRCHHCCHHHCSHSSGDSMTAVPGRLLPLPQQPLTCPSTLGPPALPSPPYPLSQAPHEPMLLLSRSPRAPQAEWLAGAATRPSYHCGHMCDVHVSLLRCLTPQLLIEVRLLRGRTRLHGTTAATLASVHADCSR